MNIDDLSNKVNRNRTTGDGAYLSLCDGNNERLGAYRLTRAGWECIDRRGRPIGTYASEREAADAVAAAAGAVR